MKVQTPSLRKMLGHDYVCDVLQVMLIQKPMDAHNPIFLSRTRQPEKLILKRLLLMKLIILIRIMFYEDCVRNMNNYNEIVNNRKLSCR